MRHGKKFNHLSRKKGHRKALLTNLSIALITHKRIFTTLAKGKALRQHLEPIITKAKSNTTHSRRVAFSYLQNKDAVTELFGPIAAKIAERQGGYLRVIKTGFRQGDNADMCKIQAQEERKLVVVVVRNQVIILKQQRKRMLKKQQKINDNNRIYILLICYLKGKNLLGFLPFCIYKGLFNKKYFY
jgi:large subunit ribosomal protein L17